MQKFALTVKYFTIQHKDYYFSYRFRRKSLIRAIFCKKVSFYTFFSEILCGRFYVNQQQKKKLTLKTYSSTYKYNCLIRDIRKKCETN